MYIFCVSALSAGWERVGEGLLDDVVWYACINIWGYEGMQALRLWMVDWLVGRLMGWLIGWWRSQYESGLWATSTHYLASRRALYACIRSINLCRLDGQCMIARYCVKRPSVRSWFSILNYLWVSMSLKMVPLSALLGGWVSLLRIRRFWFRTRYKGAYLLMLFHSWLRVSHEQYGIDAAVHFAIVLNVDVSGRKRALACWTEWEKRTVICAYLPHITLPPAVTIPSSLVGGRRVRSVFCP